jgi:hypothetical protein
MYLEDVDVHALGIEKVEAVSSPKKVLGVDQLPSGGHSPLQ